MSAVEDGVTAGRGDEGLRHNSNGTEAAGAEASGSDAAGAEAVGAGGTGDGGTGDVAAGAAAGAIGLGSAKWALIEVYTTPSSVAPSSYNTPTEGGTAFGLVLVMVAAYHAFAIPLHPSGGTLGVALYLDLTLRPGYSGTRVTASSLSFTTTRHALLTFLTGLAGGC